MNLWKEIRPGTGFPKESKAVIEVPCGSHVKFAADPSQGYLLLKDFLLSPTPFPFHYGFFPQTVGTDGDPLDLILLCSQSLPAMSVVFTRPIGAVELDYPNKGQEKKIIAVAVDDPLSAGWKQLSDVPETFLAEIRHFYETFRTFDKHGLKCRGFLEKEAAHREMELAAARFGNRNGIAWFFSGLFRALHLATKVESDLAPASAGPRGRKRPAPRKNSRKRMDISVGFAKNADTPSSKQAA